MMASASVSLSFSEATQKRRTMRALEASSTVSDTAIVELAEAAILNVPSAFNSQTTRLTVLFGDEHKKLWSMAGDLLLAKIGEQRWNEGTKERIANFLKSYGTILFWDDKSQATGLKEHAPEIYKDKTDEWVHQSNGMHQYHLWVALEALGMGANVQHYNPLIDNDVKKTWGISEDWQLRAQMVFGIPKEGSAPGEKEQKLSVEQRLQVFGASSKI